jgi:4-hydroxy-3-polyprenylbenzoate decarboxylase
LSRLYWIIIYVNTMPEHGQTLTLAITGASGAIYAREMLRTLAADARITCVHLVASENALRVFAEELNLSGRTDLIKKLLGSDHTSALAKFQQHPPEDIGASIASGSYLVDAMIVLPCSMGTLAGIANGMASNLIERAADVCLKERRRLVLCIRETPFHTIHLRNMQYAAQAGATIYPVIPTHYNHPASEMEMAQQFVYRVLAHIGLPQPGAYVWQG